MLWEILILEVLLGQYFHVIAGEPPMEDAVLQAHVGEGAPHLHLSARRYIQSLPALPQGPLAGHGCYRVKLN